MLSIKELKSKQKFEKSFEYEILVDVYVDHDPETLSSLGGSYLSKRNNVTQELNKTVENWENCKHNVTIPCPSKTELIAKLSKAQEDLSKWVRRLIVPFRCKGIKEE